MTNKKQAGTAPVKAAALPEDTKTAPNTVLYHDHFQFHKGDGVTFLCPDAKARISAATNGIKTLPGLLLQREIDADDPESTDRPLTMCNRTAMGILDALASCAAVVEHLVGGTGTPWTKHIHGFGPEAEELRLAANNAANKQHHRRAEMVVNWGKGGAV